MTDKIFDELLGLEFNSDNDATRRRFIDVSSLSQPSV